MSAIKDRPLSLSDDQLGEIMLAARSIDPERRHLFLERIGAMLKVRHRFNDTDVNEVVGLALRGLIQTTADNAA